jgi:carbon-monoxide dehydrogenase large subunit
MVIDHLETLSSLSPTSLKDVGESGALPVPAVLASAIEDVVGPEAGTSMRMALEPAGRLDLLSPPLPESSALGS